VDRHAELVFNTPIFVRKIFTNFFHQKKQNKKTQTKQNKTKKPGKPLEIASSFL